MKRKKIFLFIILIFFCSLTFAQEQFLLKGKVISSTDGSGLPGAAVVELDKNNRVVRGVMTDMDGNYAMMLTNKNNKVQVSFIGYKTYVIEIGGKSEININLEEDVTVITGVDVYAEKRTNTGFIDVKDRDLAIPVEKMSTKDIEDVQATSIDEAIQGRLAGVDIVSNSGDPGSGMSVRIRGVSSLRPNQEPLVVVDGVPYSVDIADDFNFATANEEGYSQMLNISVSDIKEISVLKDAAATALYGSKAANGVLLITTKRGIKGQEPTIAYTYRGTFIEEPPIQEMLSGDEYITYILEGYMNSYNFPLITQNRLEFANDPSQPYYYYNYGQNTNWLDAIQRKGITHNNEFSISGGGDKARYRFSATYQDQVGTTVGTDYSRLTNMLNLDYDISDKLMVTADFSYTRGERGSSYDKYLRDKAYRKMPNMSIYEYDEEGNLTPNYFSPAQNVQGYYTGDNRTDGTYNIVAMANEAFKKTMNNTLSSRLALRYRLLEELNYDLDIKYTLDGIQISSFLPQIVHGLDADNDHSNKAFNEDDDTYTIYTKNKLSFVKTIKEIHAITATLSLYTDDYNIRKSSITRTNAPSSSLTDPAGGGRILATASSNDVVRNYGISAFIHYSLLDRYIIMVGANREGNSKFDEANRYAFLPSISAAWRLSGEPFMQGISGRIDDLRLKASYGQTGRQPRYTGQFFSNYITNDWTYLNQKGVYSTSMQLVNMGWEKFTTRNVGFTLEMFKHRLFMDMELYKNTTDNMLDDAVSISSISGYKQIAMNIGTIDIYGSEFSFRATPVSKGKLIIDLSFNISKNYNILRSVSESYQLDDEYEIELGKFKEGAQVDNPMGAFYGFNYLGVYQDEEDLVAIDKNGDQIFDANGNPIKMIFNYPTVGYEFKPGDAKYEDVNHDGNIDKQDIVYLGESNPDFTGGFGSTIKYSNLSLNVYFYARVGNDIINQTQISTESMYNYNNQSKTTLSRWRNETTETDMPRALLGDGYNWLGSSRYVHDGSFMRLKYITLSYKLSNKTAQKLGLKNLSISTTLNNLLTFTNYTGQDPEISIKSYDGNVWSSGYDYSNTPATRQVTFTLSTQF